MAGLAENTTDRTIRQRTCVPIWVPDESDPQGLEGTWQLVDPDASDIDPHLLAQARAVASMWSTNAA